MLAFGALAALGTWQVHRRAWKLDLIERVDARIHAPPAPLPGPEAAPAGEEYRRVRATGTFLDKDEAQVAAATELGAGYWVMTPLRTGDGRLVLVNRGFVPPERRDPATRPAAPTGEAVVTGLLRLNEPGTWLRPNDPAADRWRTRDALAIAAARGLHGAPPYFIDADAAGNGPGAPVGGLTVVTFHNNHLVYAITWYGLAAMVAGGAAHVFRQEWRARRAGA